MKQALSHSPNPVPTQSHGPSEAVPSHPRQPSRLLPVGGTGLSVLYQRKLDGVWLISPSEVHWDS